MSKARSIPPAANARLAGFRPCPLLRNTHVQSIVAASVFRRLFVRARATGLEAASREQVLDCGDGVRLQGFSTPALRGGRSRGLVVLLHGWEGCHRSAYLLSAADRLRRRGYEIFRLNFRDHGESHGLNEGLFHSCRLDEVVAAVREVSRLCRTRPLFLVGFSLGGNFALRVARRAVRDGLPLNHAVAVNPVVDPEHTLVAMERGPRLYERYFVRLWRRSLARKQALFPKRYDFSDWMRLASLREQTRHLVRRYAGFDSLEQYLDGYSIAGDRLAGLEVPCTVIAAADDPIIPVGDLRAVRAGAGLRRQVQRHGGHVGYLEGPRRGSWLDRKIGTVLAAAVGEGLA